MEKPILYSQYRRKIEESKSKPEPGEAYTALTDKELKAQTEEEKVDKEEEITVTITGIFTEDELKEQELPANVVGEAVSSTYKTFDTALSLDGVKRGDKLYLTALFNPSSNRSQMTPANIGVIEVKVTDMWRGLTKLNQLRSKK